MQYIILHCHRFTFVLPALPVFYQIHEHKQTAHTPLTHIKLAAVCSLHLTCAPS